MNLDELEKKLTREINEERISPAVESALLREFDRKWNRGSRGVYMGAIAALAACLLLAAFWPKAAPVVNTPAMAAATAPPRIAQPVAAVSTQPGLARRPRRERLAAAPDEPNTANDGESQFLRIPYSPPLAPYERAEILRVDLPVSALLAAGFHIAGADTGASAQADVIVGEDGMAHALRLISISSN